MPFWKSAKLTSTTHTTAPPKWNTNTDSYDIKGNDHLQHVQAKLDEVGETEFKIVLPQPNQLQLDYDSPELPAQFEAGLRFLTQSYCKVREFLTYTVTASKSGNRHVIVDLPKNVVLDPATRIAWQAILGSDLQREGLSMMSVIRGIANPTLLLEREGNIVNTGVSIRKGLPEVVGRKFRD